MSEKKKIKNKDKEPGKIAQWWMPRNKHFWATFGLMGFAGILLWLLINIIKAGINFGITKIADHQLGITDWAFSVPAFFIILAIVLFVSFILACLFNPPKDFKFANKSEDTTFGSSKFLIDEREKPTKEQWEEFEETYPSKMTEPSWLIASRFNKKGQFEYNSIPVKKSFNSENIGSVGSGKSQIEIINNILLNAKELQEYGNQPSFVITDPKGEIYSATASLLNKYGYKVKTMNLKNPSLSDSYNFLGIAYDYLENSMYYQDRFITLEPSEEEQKNSVCLIHKLKGCEDCMKKFPVLDTMTNTLVIRDDYKNYLARQKDAQRVKCTTELENLVQNIVTTPDSAGSNELFYEGARSILKATLLMLVEMKEDEPDLFTKKQFNLPTLLSLVSDQQLLTHVFLEYGRAHTNRESWKTGSGSFNSNSNTLSSFFVNATQGLAAFKDSNLREILVNSSIDFNDMANPEQPMALFLIVPDTSPDKDKFVSIFISQLYNSLVYQASLLVDKKGRDELDRMVLFILDEFANMPRIRNFNRIISVSRGRGIFFELILQDEQQLMERYKGIEEVIKTNSPLYIYLKTTNQKTLQEISNRLGNYTLEMTNKAQDDEAQARQTTTIKQVPLMTPDEIQNLNIGANGDISNQYIIVMLKDTRPSIVKVLPFFKIKDYYGKGKPIDRPLNQMIDFEKDYYFDLYGHLGLSSEDIEEITANTNRGGGFNKKQSKKDQKSEAEQVKEKLSQKIDLFEKTVSEISIADATIAKLDDFVQNHRGDPTFQQQIDVVRDLRSFMTTEQSIMNKKGKIRGDLLEEIKSDKQKQNKK